MQARNWKSRLIVPAIFGFLTLVAGAADNGGGTIRGTVRLAGIAPPIPIQYPQRDVEVCGHRGRPSQSLLMGTNQSVREAIIYLGGGAAGARREESGIAPAILDQRNCEFVPRIQLARSGAPLVLKNGDPLLHVVRIDSLSGTNGPKTLLKVATPYAGFEKKYQLANFKEPALLKAVCANGHNWMTAYIAVLPNSLAALTDDNGNFVISGIPAGTHKVYAWHEVLGTLVREVKVSGVAPITVDFSFSTAK